MGPLCLWQCFLSKSSHTWLRRFNFIWLVSPRFDNFQVFAANFVEKYWTPFHLRKPFQYRLKSGSGLKNAANLERNQESFQPCPKASTASEKQQPERLLMHIFKINWSPSQRLSKHLIGASPKWTFQKKNQNFAQFWKSPCDSGTHQVWVYREKFNIDFLAQNFFLASIHV